MTVNQAQLEAEIEAMELHQLYASELAALASGIDPQAMTERRARKAIRYKLYRLQTEASGGPSIQVAPAFKRHYENQPGFDGFKNFGITWDVAMDDPAKVVHRDTPIAAEWDDLVKAKFPIILPGGKIRYPDATVKLAVEAHQAEG